MKTAVECTFCGEVVDTAEKGAYRRVIGWTKTRSQGGSNAIALTSDPLGWAHGTCIDIQKLRGDIAWQEKPLF